MPVLETETKPTTNRPPVLAVIVGREGYLNLGLTLPRIAEREKDQWDFPITSSDPVFDLLHQWNLQELLDRNLAGVHLRNASYAENMASRAGGRMIRHHYYREGDLIGGLHFAPANPSGTEVIVEASPPVAGRIKRRPHLLENLTATGVRIPERSVVDLVTRNNTIMPFYTMERIALAVYGLQGMKVLMVEDPNVLVRVARERELAAKGLRRVIPSK